MESFPLIDLLFVLVIFLLFFRGFLKGTFKELISLGTIIFTYYIVNILVPLGFLEPILIRYGFPQTYFKWILFLLIWFAFSLFFYVVFKFVSLKTKSCLGRSLGGVISVIKGYILFFLIFPFLSSYSSFEIKLFEKSNSMFFTFMQNLKHLVFDFFGLSGLF